MHLRGLYSSFFHDSIVLHCFTGPCGTQCHTLAWGIWVVSILSPCMAMPGAISYLCSPVTAPAPASQLQSYFPDYKLLSQFTQSPDREPVARLSGSDAPCFSQYHRGATGHCCCVRFSALACKDSPRNVCSSGHECDGPSCLLNSGSGSFLFLQPTAQECLSHRRHSTVTAQRMGDCNTHYFLIKYYFAC